MEEQKGWKQEEKKLYFETHEPLSLGFPIVSEVKGKMCLVRVLFFLQAL
jgi:hypothetical protein